MTPATKLHIPARRRGRIPRAALVALLVEGASRKLTLVDAPAGFGKTTLLAEWHDASEDEQPFAWVSLDEGDNDPTRFWSSVIAGLRAVQPEIGVEAEAALTTRNIGLLEVVLPLLINDLMSLRQRIVLVLDDYHVVGEERVHESLRFFVDHLPPSLHLALATRSDPPLPLGRLRTEGEMTEIRAAELRFSDAEAAALLAAAVGVELDAEDVARLQERTEGWPAGLYLAALSLRGRDDARDFIASFAGDERHIVDYLVSEVLAGLPEELRTFLLRTSILGRMCAPLCDAVAGSEGSARTLERIERSNMFLVPLDSTREWYRYHHLFRDLLGHELEIVEPALVPDLHRRAFEWHRAAGAVAEAIHHAAAAGDVDEVRELIAENWNAAFNQGRLETVERWLESIPRDAVAGDPRLCVANAWLAMDSGNADTARRWIAAAEEGLAGGSGAGDVELDTAVLRAVHRLKVGDVGQAETVARRMLERGPSGDAFAWTVAHLILGAALYWRGALSEAVDALREAAQLAREAGNDLGHSYGLGYQALAEAELGELEEAEALAATALGLSDDPGFVEHFVSMVGHLARGTVEQRRGRLDAAEASLARAVELARRGAGQLELAAGLLALGEVRHSLGDREGARDLVREARRALVECADPGTLGSRVAAAERGPPATSRSRQDGTGADDFTERELAVLRLLNSELSLREVGTALFVSLNTVKTHTRGIYRKLGAATRADAVRRARELKLL